MVLTCVLLMAAIPSVYAAGGTSEDGKVDVTGMVMDHVSDSYEWHIFTWNDTHVSIPLPVILYSKTSGFHAFLSSHFHHGTEEYNGFYIAQAGEYKGKILEKNVPIDDIRPYDISITKNALSLMMGSVLLVILILGVARWYKKNSKSEVPKAPKGFVGFMEMFIMDLVDNMIKPCIGKNYRKFVPYLLTAFFFIFLNNLMGLVPIFPGGANVTGNISVTLVLALFTFVIVNVFGTKEYYKEIFWPDVPTWLKVPVPIMPAIEFVGALTKPFALMIRLFANILAGHSIVLGLMSLIFVTASMGTAVFGSMTFLSVLMTIFMNVVELLVAYIQAYVFTMLSAVFIGLAQAEPHHAKEHKTEH